VAYLQASFELEFVVAVVVAWELGRRVVSVLERQQGAVVALVADLVFVAASYLDFELEFELKK